MAIFKMISLGFGDDDFFVQLYIIVKLYGQGIGRFGTIGDKGYFTRSY